jgi:hypothetical protein
MPVSQLLVEGKLDLELLQVILAGNPVVASGGSKDSLAPQARNRRQETRTNTVCYVRDRDFDSEPPGQTDGPTEDRRHAGTVLGWRWCRHEIESYLLEPPLVTAATGWDMAEYTSQLLQAARQIRHYQIARWAIGNARRNLPPHYDLRTRPDEANDRDFFLPSDLGEEPIGDWVRQHIAAFFRRVQNSLGPDAVERSLADYAGRISEERLRSPADVLLWCSGKDLFAALAPWLQRQGSDPGKVRAQVRDWIRGHPDETLTHLPEWASFRQTLRAYSVAGQP